MSCARWLASLAVGLVTTTVAAEPLAIRDLFQPRARPQLTVSPDGTYVTHVAVDQSGYRIVITDREYPDYPRIREVGPYAPRNLQWVDDGTLTFEAGGALFAAGQRSSLPSTLLENLYVDDGELNSMSEFKRSMRYWSIPAPLRDQSDQIVVTGYNAKGYSSVYSLDTESGEPVEIENGKREKIDRWLVDRTGSPRMAVRIDKDRATYLIRHPETQRWVEHDEWQSDGAIKLNYDGRSYLQRRVLVMGYGYDANTLYIAERITGDRFRLVHYDPITGEIVRVLHEDPRYDVAGNDFTPSTLIWDDANQQLTGITYLGEHWQTVWFDQGLADYQSRLADQRPGEAIYLTAFSDDRQVLLAVANDAQGRSQALIYYPEDDQIDVLGDFHEALREQDTPKRERVRYTARDGTEIEAYLTLPTGVSRAEARDLPLIVQPHGGPWIRSTPLLDPESAYFASRGYAVLDMNFRGSTGYGLEHLTAGFGEFAARMIDDIADGAHWAIDVGIADADRVFVMGWSYGGYAALMSGIRYPDLYKAVVSGAAPVDIGLQIKGYRREDNYLAYELWRELLGDPRREKEALQAISPLFQLERLTTPTLLFHGDADNIVPVEHAKRYEKRMRELKREPNVRILRDEGHGFSYRNNRKYFLEASLRHFEATNKEQ
ncbi:MAG: prolyl oligopeptidase family serine peptidase [Pseudomonadota bacterium]